eukprot:GHUV01008925.1.p4 GENE.GHUV01008925.1~~GHUV01008925.1.p4  ORF type:complete len:132 (+),score=35.02 GHUV01008925.1:597-992(+)
MAALEWTIPAGFPVAVKTATVDIDGCATDIICSLYADAVVLIATQTGTAGTIIQAKQDSTFEGKTTFSTSILVGKRDEILLTVAARQLVEQANSNGLTKPLICCLALRKHTPEGIKQLLAAVGTHKLLTHQ